MPRRVPAARSVEQLGRAQGAGGEGGGDRRREERSRQRPAAHLLEHHAHFEQADPAAAVLLGHQQARPTQLDQRVPQRRRDPRGVVGQLAHHVRPALALEGAARHLLQRELLVVVREVHGLPYVSLTDAPFPDTGVRVHGGRVPFPRGFCPCTGGREVPRRVARLARRASAPLLGGRSPRRRRQPLGRGEPAASPEVAAQAHEGGWAAIHWGPDYAQGRTINAMQRLLYSEVMAEYRTPGTFNTNGIWQIGPMIIQWGTEEQKAQWLPSILEAEEHWCQGFSEPMAGNDLANLRTTAIYDAETDEYVINGSKIWISSAHLATWGLFLLRTDPTAIERGKKHEGITAFILNLKTPGIDVRPDPRHGGRGALQRDLLHRCAHPGQVAPGRRGRRLDGGHGHPRLRARRHRLADRHPGRRPARHGGGRPQREPGRARRPVAAGPHRQGVDRDRAGASPVAAGAVQNHEGREELARGPLRQALVVLHGPDARRARRRPPRPRRRPRHAAVPTRSTGASGPACTPSSATRPSAAAPPRFRRTSSPTGPSPCPASRAADPLRPVARRPPRHVHHRRRPPHLAPVRRARRCARAARHVGAGGP